MLGGLSDRAQGSVGTLDLDGVDRAIVSALVSPRRRHLALEAEGDEGGGAELVHALDPEPAAVSPGAARILANAVLHDPHGWKPRLHDLDGIVASGGASEDDQPGFTVRAWTRSRASGVQVALDEELAGLGMRAERDGRHLITVGASRNLVGHGRCERAEA